MICCISESGRINCYRLIDSPANKNRHMLCDIAKRIGNIAEHHSAEVVVGRLNSGLGLSSQANRRIKGMCQYRLRQIPRYKLPLRGIPVKEYSEALTSEVGSAVGRALGSDVHKGSAYALALKAIDYGGFQFLRGALPMGRWKARGRLSAGRRLTACIQLLAHGHEGWMPMIREGEPTPLAQGMGRPAEAGPQSADHGSMIRRALWVRPPPSRPRCEAGLTGTSGADVGGGVIS